MDIVVNAMLLAAAVLLATSAVVGIQRIAAGPSQLDRSIGADLMVGVVIGSIGIWATYADQDTEIVILLLLSMLGFTGAVSIARLVSERVVYRPRSDDKKREARP
jgi:multicomponent Na+:H+ antiporter subunit F